MLSEINGTAKKAASRSTRKKGREIKPALPPAPKLEASPVPLVLDGIAANLLRELAKAWNADLADVAAAVIIGDAPRLLDDWNIDMRRLREVGTMGGECEIEQQLVREAAERRIARLKAEIEAERKRMRNPEACCFAHNICVEISARNSDRLNSIAKLGGVKPETIVADMIETELNGCEDDYCNLVGTIDDARARERRARRRKALPAI